MTTEEYEILDELYFVISFKELLNNVTVSSQQLEEHLINMIDKGWVNYYTEVEGEMNPDILNGAYDLTILYFLASKKGLFAHNSA